MIWKSKAESKRFHPFVLKVMNDFYCFSLNLTNGSGRPELVKPVASDVNLWHWQLGSLKRKMLNLLKKQNHDEASFDGTGPDYNVSVVNTNNEIAYPETDDHKVKHSFPILFTGLIISLTPEKLVGYKNARKNCNQYTKWTEAHPPKSKGDALSTFQSFVQSVVTASGFGIDRMKVDKGGEKIKEGYCLRTEVSLE